MYTFQPVFDFSDCHGGFYIVLTLCLAFYVFIILNAVESWVGTLLGLVTFIPAVIAGNVSFIPHHPLNTEVIGTFVSYQPEGYRSGGKHPSDHHVMYVVYNTPAGNVILEGASNVVYPARAILYYNAR